MAKDANEYEQASLIGTWVSYASALLRPSSSAHMLPPFPYLLIYLLTYSLTGGTRPLLVETDASGKAIGGGESSSSSATAAAWTTSASGGFPTITFDIPGVGKAAIKDKTLGRPGLKLVVLSRLTHSLSLTSLQSVPSAPTR